MKLLTHTHTHIRFMALWLWLPEETFSLQCFDTVGWASGRASGLLKLSDEVLVWLSVWCEVQIVCMWSSWCHCRPETPSSLASFKSRLVVPLWYRLTQVVVEKRPLNGCSPEETFPHSCPWRGRRRIRTTWSVAWELIPFIVLWTSEGC